MSFDISSVKLKKTKFKIEQNLLESITNYIQKYYRPLLLGEISNYFDISLAYTELYIEFLLKNKEITMIVENGYEKYWHL